MPSRVDEIPPDIIVNPEIADPAPAVPHERVVKEDAAFGKAPTDAVFAYVVQMLARCDDPPRPGPLPLRCSAS